MAYGISEALTHGVLTASQLTHRLAISPATLMRRVQQESGRVLRFGQARATRYGLIQAWPLLQSVRFPVVRIDEAGAAIPDGELITLAARQSVWLPSAVVSNGSPIEFSDAAPSGFLGRIFASEHSDLGLPSRVIDWSDHHVLLALSRRGDSLPGNLIVGQESLDRWFGARLHTSTTDDYPELADAALAGRSTGDWLGGDRPKFTTFVDGRHVLVKFAGQSGGAGSATERWRDLLALEALALDVLREHDVPAARTELLSSDTYKFLEVERFDRVGERGRRAVMTLAAVRQEPAESWSHSAVRLLEAKEISAEDARRLRLLDAFGALIANTDRHHHNIAFFPTETGYTLAPAFDQLPMLYAPSGDGSVPAREFHAPRRTAEMLDVWDDARALALSFWQNASDGPTITATMRRIAAENARLIQNWRG